MSKAIEVAIKALLIERAEEVMAKTKTERLSEVEELELDLDDQFDELKNLALHFVEANDKGRREIIEEMMETVENCNSVLKQLRKIEQDQEQVKRVVNQLIGK